MPPKGSQKAKAQDASAPKPKPKPSTTANTTPKKPNKFKTLARDSTIPIDVTFEGESTQAILRKNGEYAHGLKLVASGSFTLVKSIVFTEGEFEGCQAIIIRPAKPFPFLKLPKEARKLIYDYYFAPKGVVDNEIPIEGKRSGDIYAKGYAEGSKNRVALLAVDKEVYEEAYPVLYAHKIRFESTTTMADFLVQIEGAGRARLTSVMLGTWVKTTSRNAMTLLAEARNIKRFHIDSNVSTTESDTAKAAKAFWADAYKFLEAVGAAKGDKAAGVDVITFGQKAFTAKDEKGTAKPWKEEKVEEFREILRGKLK